MYSVQSFWTAAHHHIPVVYIIPEQLHLSYLEAQHEPLSAYARYPRAGLDTQLTSTNPTLDFVEIAHGMSPLASVLLVLRILNLQ